MDITFSCEKCGQNIVVDEAGAGITFDCPRCGRPVYVPSIASSTTNNVGNAQSRVATLGKLAGVSTRLNLFEPLKWSIIKNER